MSLISSVLEYHSHFLSVQFIIDDIENLLWKFVPVTACLEEKVEQF